MLRILLKNTMNKIIASAALAFLVVFAPVAASAHVLVQPTNVAPDSYQKFNVSVPNEKAMAITGFKLLIPTGLKDVSPTVKPGWLVDIKTNGQNVTELIWSAGTIPAGQRDDFSFGGQSPAKTTSLVWKAYETYEDGSVISWDQMPSSKQDGTATPYSITKVVSDVHSAPLVAIPSITNNAASPSNVGLALGTLGVLLGAAALLSKRHP